MSMFILFVFWSMFGHYCHGAERIDVRSFLRDELHRRHGRPEPVTSHRFKRDADVISTPELDESLALGPNVALKTVATFRTAQGTLLKKRQELYNGLTVRDAVMILETDGDDHDTMVTASGTLYRNVHRDFLNANTNQLSEEEAVALCMQHHGDTGVSPGRISRQRAEEEVRVQTDKQQQEKAYLVYKARYLVSPSPENANQFHRQPTCLIDVRDSSIIESYNDVQTYSYHGSTGTGGNLKIGKIRYGKLDKILNLRRVGDTCYLNNEYVSVFDFKHNTRPTYIQDGDLLVATYNCIEIDDYVNGGFSPLLDALFYGTVVGKMFEEWYEMPVPVKSSIRLGVHYGKNVNNAASSGDMCVFGDGDGISRYPFVILDIVAHEIGHSITYSNSGLKYNDQPGGVNEAFSDITGETAKAYLNASDWLVGSGLVVWPEHAALRYFDKPERDGQSIAHVDRFRTGMNSHHSSGVFNHAFYSLVQGHGLSIRYAYQAFLQANRVHWGEDTSFAQAACGVMRTAYSLGLDGGKFNNSFRDVGMEVCDVSEDFVHLQNRTLRPNIHVSCHQNPSFVFEVDDQMARFVTVRVSSPLVKITLSDKKWGSEENFQVYASGYRSVVYRLSSDCVRSFTVELSMDSCQVGLKNVMLLAAHSVV